MTGQAGAASSFETQRPHSYRDHLDRDRHAPPEHFFDLGDDDAEVHPVAVERYTSREFYERERPMWDKVWQMTCREEHIPNIGDLYQYDICNRSYLIIRVSANEIKAYPNACLHRGRRLCDGNGNVGVLKCPFHGFTWHLDGTFAGAPCRWDFSHLSSEALKLPEVRVGRWAGWVFINPDPDCMPLERYLDPISEHYQRYLWEQSYLAVHIGKVLRGNWKVVQEAFFEAYHVLATHPQILPFNDDIGCQYDHWNEKPHVLRMMVPFGVASPHAGSGIAEQQIYNSYCENGLGGDPDYILAPGETARHVFADRNREAAAEATGEDLSTVSDAELIDGWYYYVFPNLMHWGGYGPNLFYRFRPWNDDHEMTLMETGFVMRHRADHPKPAPASFKLLGVDEPWASAEELGALGFILDQDTDNLVAVQQGLKATFKAGINTANYQEGNIRHFHRTLDQYIGASSK